MTSRLLLILVATVLSLASLACRTTSDNTDYGAKRYAVNLDSKPSNAALYVLEKKKWDQLEASVKTNDRVAIEASAFEYGAKGGSPAVVQVAPAMKMHLPALDLVLVAFGTGWTNHMHFKPARKGERHTVEQK